MRSAISGHLIATSTNCIPNKNCLLMLVDIIFNLFAMAFKIFLWSATYNAECTYLQLKNNGL